MAAAWRESAAARSQFGGESASASSTVPVTRVANFTYSSILAYNTESFAGDAHPKSWADFWNSDAFPGPRMLADMATGTPNLEFALLADGVALRDSRACAAPHECSASFEDCKPGHLNRRGDVEHSAAQRIAIGEASGDAIWNLA